MDHIGLGDRAAYKLWNQSVYKACITTTKASFINYVITEGLGEERRAGGEVGLIFDDVMNDA